MIHKAGKVKGTKNKNKNLELVRIQGHKTAS